MERILHGRRAWIVGVRWLAGVDEPAPAPGERP